MWCCLAVRRLDPRRLPPRWCTVVAPAVLVLAVVLPLAAVTAACSDKDQETSASTPPDGVPPERLMKERVLLLHSETSPAVRGGAER